MAASTPVGFELGLPPVSVPEHASPDEVRIWHERKGALRVLTELPLRAQLLRCAASILTTVPLRPATAWCNGYFEGRISNDVQESAVPFVAGSYSTNIFVKNVRPPSRRVMGGSVSFPTLPSLPPVVVVGCPGVACDYCVRHSQSNHAARSPM